MEIELKLLIDAADTDTLCRLPLLEQHAIEKPCKQEIVSTYFDTPDFHIRRHDAALRVRHVDGGWMQTLKGGGSVEAGLHRRHEWETPVAGSRPDLAALRPLVEPDTTWEKLLRIPALEERLLPVFTTRVQRTIWQLRLACGDEIEFALDQGTLEHDDTHMPINEVELELKSGKPGHLYDFALELLHGVPMHIGNISKAERGYALYLPQQPAIVKAARLKLSRSMTAEQGFQAIAANCIAQIQGNETGVMQGQDPESIHQMRVGLRRLRSALGMFKDVVPCPAAIQQELVWLATQLGAARDWDVLADSTLATVARAAPGNTGMAMLQQAAADMARDKHEQASAAVKSVRYARLILSLSNWVQQARWRASVTAPERSRLSTPLGKFAGKISARDQGKLLKRGKRLHGGDPQARHRVRIAAKKARYASEFFQSLYRSGRVRRYVDALAKLQDELGWLNDAAVADGLLRQLQETRSELAGSAGFARGYLAARVERDDRMLRKLWKRFIPIKLPSEK